MSLLADSNVSRRLRSADHRVFQLNRLICSNQLDSFFGMGYDTRYLQLDEKTGGETDETKTMDIGGSFKLPGTSTTLNAWARSDCSLPAAGVGHARVTLTARLCSARGGCGRRES